MNVHTPRQLSKEALCLFHTEEYIEFLNKITPSTQYDKNDDMRRHNLGEDCPVFEGVLDFCSTYSGGSVQAAHHLNHGKASIAINWSGGLHHARRDEASGFCYVNDIVLAIIELLKYHARVLYIDIDIHHGDAVQEAFYMTDRVMTLSLHKYGHDFFPGTGAEDEIGKRGGKYFSVNIPLDSGIDDRSYISLFKPIVDRIIERYRPSVIVMQCGADSLAADMLGVFNLSSDAHAECVDYVKGFNIPLLVLGGGGYTVKNVARCWAYETAILLGKGQEVGDTDLPFNDYFEYFGPDFQLRPPELRPGGKSNFGSGNMFVDRRYENLNSKSVLDGIRKRVIENIDVLEFAPCVQMNEIPAEVDFIDYPEDDDYRSASRMGSHSPSNSLDDSDDSGEEDDDNNDLDYRGRYNSANFFR